MLDIEIQICILTLVSAEIHFICTFPLLGIIRPCRMSIIAKSYVFLLEVKAGLSRITNIPRTDV